MGNLALVAGFIFILMLMCVLVCFSSGNHSGREKLAISGIVQEEEVEF
jgi:hypothetical protein